MNAATTTASIETVYDDFGPAVNAEPVDVSDYAGPIRVVRDGAGSRPRRSLFRSPIVQVGHVSIFFGVVLLDVLDEWIFGPGHDESDPN